MVYGCVPLSAVSSPHQAVCVPWDITAFCFCVVLCAPGRVTGLPGLHPSLCIRGASVCHKIGFLSSFLVFVPPRAPFG